jgi:hypothetical protein
MPVTRNIRKPGQVGNLEFITFTQNCNGLIRKWHRNPGQHILPPLAQILDNVVIK